MLIPLPATKYSLFIVTILVSLTSAGCSSRNRTSYLSTCRDGFQSRASTPQASLNGCLSHGGALNPTPQAITQSRPATRRSSSRRRSKRSRRR